jgi:hypothetical protein
MLILYGKSRSLLHIHRRRINKQSIFLQVLRSSAACSSKCPKMKSRPVRVITNDQAFLPIATWLKESLVTDSDAGGSTKRFTFTVLILPNLGSQNASKSMNRLGLVV